MQCGEQSPVPESDDFEVRGVDTLRERHGLVEVPVRLLFVTRPELCDTHTEKGYHAYALAEKRRRIGTNQVEESA